MPPPAAWHVQSAGDVLALVRSAFLYGFPYACCSDASFSVHIDFCDCAFGVVAKYVPAVLGPDGRGLSGRLRFDKPVGRRVSGGICGIATDNGAAVRPIWSQADPIDMYGCFFDRVSRLHTGRVDLGLFGFSPIASCRSRRSGGVECRDPGHVSDK